MALCNNNFCCTYLLLSPAPFRRLPHNNRPWVLLLLTEHHILRSRFPDTELAFGWHSLPKISTRFRQSLQESAESSWIQPNYVGECNILPPLLLTFKSLVYASLCTHCPSRWPHTLSCSFTSLSLSALHALQWLCSQHSTFGGISISIYSCLLHTVSCVASCIFALQVLSLHLCMSASPHFCISLHFYQTSSSHAFLLHCSHFVLLHGLCPSPALIDIGISRCYQTSMAFPLCHCMHLGGFWCVGFRVLLFFLALESV